MTLLLQRLKHCYYRGWAALWRGDWWNGLQTMIFIIGNVESISPRIFLRIPGYHRDQAAGTYKLPLYRAC
jgi:hypothetical protein